VLYRMVVLPVTLVTPNHPKPPNYYILRYLGGSVAYSGNVLAINDRGPTDHSKWSPSLRTTNRHWKGEGWSRQVTH